MWKPSYLSLLETGELRKRAERVEGLLRSCRLCPRLCGIDRTSGETGFCRTGRLARVASYGPHFGEEAPLVGTNGSGTIFFSSCNLLCSFCQNHEISHLCEGEDVDARTLAAMMMDLAERGCHNINLVSPSHVVGQILEAVSIAAASGLDVPIVYNSGGYDSLEALALLEDVVDIYMPDFKFWDEEPARRFCAARNYRNAACTAVIEMHRQVGDLVMDEKGIALRGLLVRHLVMPGGLAGTPGVMGFLAENVSRDTYVNVMDQYHPCFRAGQDPLINRRVTRAEYTDAVEAALSAGLKRLDTRRRFLA